MPILLKKKTAQAAPQVSPEVANAPSSAIAEIIELVERLGPMQEEADKVNARIKKEQEKLKPYTELVKELKGKLNSSEFDEDQPVELKGAHYRLEAGARGTSREIVDMAQVKKDLGEVTFMKLASIKLSDIDKYLNPQQQAKVIKSSRTDRSVKIIRRAS